MSHTALARKYRPRRFDDVATQEHVSETLRRAVISDRVGHAYLFCGPRGVGKTTLARVLAMALNCPDRSEDGEPCGTCESCGRIWGGHTALDVVEIDAASNRGVDDARDLRERAMYAPSEEGRFKIYIVDEAHMLTREAWNALLKILEEPPPRVIFVFATTEPLKIQQSAAPILSRCQRFDFRRIGVSDIVARLTTVLEREGLPAPEDALRIIARKADGGMRDGLSLLDQVLSLTGGEVDIEAVRRVLGLVEEERYLELLDVLIEGRHGDVFTVVEQLLDEGYDLVEFYHGLMEVLRTVLRLRLSPDADVDLRADLRAAFVERGESFAPGDLVRMLSAAAQLEASGSMRRSANPRVLVEMLLLRLSYLDRTVDLQELLRAMGGAPTPEGGAGRGGVPARRASASAPVTPAADAEQAGTTGAAVRKPVRKPALDEALDSAASIASEGGDSGGPAPTGDQAVEESPGSPAPSASVPEAWSRWLDSGTDVPRGMTAFLRSTRVTEAADGSVEIAPPPGPTMERLQELAVQEQVRRGLAPFLGRSPALILVHPEESAPEPKRITDDEVRSDTLKALYRKEPRLETAVEELDLELMD